jgi:hypothetical protein
MVETSDIYAQPVRPQCPAVTQRSPPVRFPRSALGMASAREVLGSETARTDYANAAQHGSIP